MNMRYSVHSGVRDSYVCVPIQITPIDILKGLSIPIDQYPAGNKQRAGGIGD